MTDGDTDGPAGSAFRPRQPHPSAARRLAVLVLVAGVAAGGCRRRQAAAPTPPPAAVSVVRPAVREVTDWDEYSGRIAATDSVEVRARVSGFVQNAPFREGALVKQGDLLYEIDARPYQADLDRAQAQVGEAEAQRRFAASEFERVSRLHQTQALSETEFLRSRQTLESTTAAVAAAQAAVATARLSLEWCRVTAPIDGRVSRKLVTPGNLVTGGPGQATPLTSIASLDPVYCYLDVDERSVRRYQRMIREEGRASARAGALPAELALTDETEFGHRGRIDFVENQLDPSTGSISVRGVFPNPSGDLLPGFFARVRVPGRGPYRATLVPEEALGTTLAQQFVLLVGPDDVVRQQPVTPGRVFNGLRAVEGIPPDARVIVAGMVQARPGAKVRPEEVPIQQAAQATQPALPEAQAASSRERARDNAAVPAQGQGAARTGSGAAGSGAGPGTGTGGGVGGSAAGGGATGAGVGGTSGAAGGGR